MKETIEKINELFDKGHTIHFNTARGMGRSDNSVHFVERVFRKITEQQLKQWGVKYHRLFLGKPSGDFYIDDKGIKDESFFRNKICS